MKLKKTIFLLSAISALSFCFVACGDDDKDDGKDKDKTPSEPATVACTAADNKCVENVLYKCTSTGFQKLYCGNTKTCDAENLRCKPKEAPQNCTDADNECRGNELWLCGADGKVAKSQDCGSKYCNASKKTCEDQCTEANNKCDGNAVYKCEGGTLTKKEDCGSDKVCDPNSLSCVKPCTAADNKCENNVLYKCDLSGDKTVKLTACNKRYCSEESWSCEKKGCSAADNSCIENADGSWSLSKCTRDAATNATKLVETPCGAGTPYCNPFKWSCDATQPPACIRNECADETHVRVCGDDGNWATSLEDCGAKNQVCNLGACAVPIVCTQNEAKCVSDTEYVICGDNAWNESDKKACPTGTHCKIGGTCVADDPVVVNDADAKGIGSKCDCPATEPECRVQIKGEHIKDFVKVDAICPAFDLAPSDAKCAIAQGIVNGIINSEDFKNATVTIPDLFYRPTGDYSNAAKFTGCDDLRPLANADTGFAVTCWRDAKVEFDENAAKLLDNMGTILSTIAGFGVDFGGVDVGALLTYIKAKFADGIPLTAGSAGNGGYCMLADLDISMSLTDEKLNQMLDMRILTGLLERGINSPNHDHGKSKFVACPEGSTKLWFDVPSISATGTANVGFDVCMKTCKTDDDCRDGNTCQYLLYGNEKTMLEDASLGTKVCFDQKNIAYFQQLSHEIDPFLPIDDED